MENIGCFAKEFMLQGIAEQMRLHDAPAELYARYGIVPKRAA